MARPSKLTPQVQDTLVEALRAGAWFSDACRAAGVKKSTAHEWHRRGRGKDRRPPTPGLVAFSQAVDAALEFAASQNRGETRVCGPARSSYVQQEKPISETPISETWLELAGRLGVDLRPATAAHPNARTRANRDRRNRRCT